MIIIAPWARPLQNQQPNPKNYPWWPELIKLIPEHIIQIGVQDETRLVPDFRPNLNLQELAKITLSSRTWISCDSFYQHFCWDLKKPGIVLWGQSDPQIFGHPENINLLKGREYLRPNQFHIWEQCDYREDCWVEPQQVVDVLYSQIFG